MSCLSYSPTSTWPSCGDHSDPCAYRGASSLQWSPDAHPMSVLSSHCYHGNWSHNGHDDLGGRRGHLSFWVRLSTENIVSLNWMDVVFISNVIHISKTMLVTGDYLHMCSWYSWIILMNILRMPINFMMTSSNGNIFHVTGPLCGEFTGHLWISLTEAGGAEPWYFLWSAPEQTVG